MKTRFVSNDGTTTTCSRREIPSTKQIESRIFDFPLPLRPVIALNMGSNPSMTVRLAYDCTSIKIKWMVVLYAARCALVHEQRAFNPAAFAVVHHTLENFLDFVNAKGKS